MRLPGARLLLTGASGGIGRALARRLSGDGATLVLTGRRAHALEQLRSELPRAEAHVVITADLEDPEAPRRLLEAAGELDGLVWAAGLPASGWLTEYDQAQLLRAMRVNIEAPMLLARGLLPSLLGARHGHLAFVASLAGKVPSPGLSIYCAGKFGLRGFALALATELKGSGVGVSVVSPGFVRDAGMFADSGSAMPPVVGSMTAPEVATRTARAITRNQLDVAAAPRRHRVLAQAMMCAPRLWLPALAGREAVETARQISAGQRENR